MSRTSTRRPIRPRGERATLASLRDVVLQRRGEILERFVEAVRASQLVPEQARPSVVVDGLPRFLDELADALWSPEGGPPTSSTSGRAHGEQRFTSGFTMEAVLAEFAVLRRCVLREAEQAGVVPSAAEFEVLADACDVAFASAVAQFAGRQQESLQAEAQDRVASRDRFLTDVSDELRTPLSALLGWCKVLRSGPADADTTRRAVDTIERNATALAHMVEDALDLSALVAGRVVLQRGRVEVPQLIEETVAAVREAAESRQLALEVDVARDLSPVQGDAARLRQVLENLLTNAIKFTGPGGKVVLGARRLGNKIQILVTDSGHGIARESLAGLFERHRQTPLRAGELGGHSSTGMGLSIVHHLLQLHGGTVTAHSAGVGKGATFEVVLPTRASAPSLPRSTTPVPPSSRNGAFAARPLDGIRILVVDDEVDARELAAMVLSQAGAEVLEAGSAGDALRLLQRQKPDVVVSDIGMPGRDGHSLIRSIRDLPTPLGGIRAMAVTAFARSEDRHRSLDAGFDMHMVKPIDPTALVGSVARLMGRDPTAAA